MMVTMLLVFTSAWAQSPAIGDNYQGGKVGYILQSGDPGYDATKIKGFVVGVTDYTGAWGIGGYLSSFTGVQASAIGTGRSNTTALINLMGAGNYFAYKFDTLTLGGYTDWYLPSQTEMLKIFQNYTLLNISVSPVSFFFQSKFYFTSTEVNTDASRAYTASYLSIGTPQISASGMGLKSASLFARPVRNFEINLCTPTSSTTPISNCVSYTWHGQTYTTSGTYTWTGTNAGGCDSTATLNLTIKQPTISTVSQTATGSYTWNGQTYTSSGTYTWTGTNAAGCDSTATLNLTINAVVINNVTNVCPYIGSNQGITYTSSVSSASSYTWTLPPNTQLVSGQGTRSIVVKLLNGFANQSNKQIRVIPSGGSLQIFYLAAQAPVTPLPIVASSTNICASVGTNVPITYTISKVIEASSNSSTATSYIWTAQNGTTNISHTNGAGENDTTVAITFETGFTSSNISVQALNACGLSSTRSYLISRNNPSQPSLISGPTNTCEYIGDNGQSATYSVSASVYVDSYTWTVPQDAIGLTGQGTNIISFKYPEGYTGGSISVTTTNNCGTSESRLLTLSRLRPSTPGNIDVINTATCPERVYTYSIASLPANATSILWTAPSSGTIVNGQGTRSITVSYPSTVIDGIVTAKAVSNCGTSGTRSVTVKLAPCPAAPSPQYTKGVMSTLPTSMNVKVFPNPTTSSFNLQVTDDGSKSVIQARVLDLQGRMMKLIQINPNENISLGSEFKPGVYMLEVLQGLVKKVVRVVKY